MIEPIELHAESSNYFRIYSIQSFRKRDAVILVLKKDNTLNNPSQYTILYQPSLAVASFHTQSFVGFE